MWLRRLARNTRALTNHLWSISRNPPVSNRADPTYLSTKEKMNRNPNTIVLALLPLKITQPAPTAAARDQSPAINSTSTKPESIASTQSSQSKLLLASEFQQRTCIPKMVMNIQANLLLKSSRKPNSASPKKSSPAIWRRRILPALPPNKHPHQIPPAMSSWPLHQEITLVLSSWNRGLQ